MCSPARSARPPRTAVPRTPADINHPGRGHSFAEGRASWRTRSKPDDGARSRSTLESDRRKSTNVLADTPVGQPRQHDRSSVRTWTRSPRARASTTTDRARAFNLELAIQMAKNNIKRVLYRVLCLVGRRGVRAWWARHGTSRPSTVKEFAKPRSNLNFDMLASPNHANFVYPGDFSDSDVPGHGAGPQSGRGCDRGCTSSKVLQVGANVPIEPTAFDGR